MPSNSKNSEHGLVHWVYSEFTSHEPLHLRESRDSIEKLKVPEPSCETCGSSGPGSSPGRGHCVVYMGKKLNSQIVSF